MANYRLFFDGSCGPKNPGGTAAYGFALFKEGQEEPAEVGSGVIGTGEGMTNNLAEFAALYEGTAAFSAKHWDNCTPATLSVFGDSNLVIQIMNRHWKPTKGKAYYESYLQVFDLVSNLRKRGMRINFDWIPRAMNTHCDDLSKAHQTKESHNVP